MSDSKNQCSPLGQSPGGGTEHRERRAASLGSWEREKGRNVERGGNAGCPEMDSGMGDFMGREGRLGAAIWIVVADSGLSTHTLLFITVKNTWLIVGGHGIKGELCEFQASRSCLGLVEALHFLCEPCDKLA